MPQYLLFLIFFFKSLPNINALEFYIFLKAKYLKGSDHCQCMLYFKIATLYLFLESEPNIGTDISSAQNCFWLSLTYMNCHKISLLICQFWQQGCREIFIQDHLNVENLSFVKIYLLSVPLYLSAFSCTLILELCPTVLCTFPHFLSWE